MTQVGGRENKAGESVGPEMKYTSGLHEYPKERDCLHHYFFRLHRNGGKGDLPYFYDIEVDEDSLTVQTWHGKPGEFMIKNHPKTCESSEELHKQVETYVKSRETIDGGPFTSHHESCRLALPENIAAAATAGGGSGSGSGSGAAAKPESGKRKASAASKEVDLSDGDDGKRRALGSGGHAAGHIVGMPPLPALAVRGSPGVPPPPPAGGGGGGGSPPPPPPPDVPPPPAGVPPPPAEEPAGPAGGVSGQPYNTSGYVSKAKVRGPYKRKTPEELLARTLERRAKKALAAATANGSTQ